MAEKVKDTVLIIGVDRDNDIGQKTGVTGPIIGRKQVLEVAQKLALKDPTESDTNALYQAVKSHDDLKKDHTVEIAILTGHHDVGLPSDEAIATQFETVLKQVSPDWAVVVTDGAEDESVLPIIQSKLPILSINRVIVKQSEKLESGYYMVKDFIQESLDNPKFAKLVFGLPAIAFILYAIFGIEGWRAIVGILGIYLFVKGFKLEHYIYGGIEEFQQSLTRSHFAFFTYVLSIIFFVFAAYRGTLGFFEFGPVGFFESIAGAVSSSIYLFLISAVLLWVGKSLKYGERSLRKIIGVILFGVSIAIVLDSAANLIILSQITVFNFFVSIIIGFVLMGIGLLVEWKG